MEERNEVEKYSFVKAVENKFTDYEAKLFENIQLSLKRRAAFLNQMSHKQRQVLALDGCQVGNAGDVREIAKLCPNLKELDLAKNYLQSWEQVSLIISQLPKLTFLNLSSNPLDSELDKERLLQLFINNTRPLLEKLVLNNTNLQLKTVFEILEIFPEIEELHLSLNNYGKVEEFERKFPQIKRIHFNRNDIHHWEDVKNIGKIFPCLKCLILCENLLKEIRIEEEGIVFQELTTLSLSDTEIEDWQSIDELRKLPALEDIRLAGIPVANNETSNTRRQLLISRLPNVKKLNGSPVSAHEREDAERAFIRHYMDCENPPARYHELIAVHGQLDKLAEVDLGRKDFAELSIFIDGNELTKIQVDLSIETGCFKRMIGKMVGVRVKDFRVFHYDHETYEPFCKTELDVACKTLNKYRMKNGDQILVEMKINEQ